MKTFGWLFLWINLSFINPPDRIEWSASRSLSWSDYVKKSTSFNNSKALAMTATSIEYTVYEKSNTPPVYVFKNYFEKKHSWTITARKDVLKHEQLHFDISELYARKMRKEMKLLNQQKEKDNRKYQKKFNELNNDMIANQKRYDKETHYNIGDGITLSDKQQFWIDSIKLELNKLKDFAN